MNIRAFLIALLPLSVMAALAATEVHAQLSDEELTRMEHFDAWLGQAFRPRALTSVEGIRSLGELEEETRSPFPASHAAPGLELREFSFDGLTIEAAVQTTEPRQVWITSIHITSPDWPLVNGLAVGDPISELEKLPLPPNAGELESCGVNNCMIASEHEGKIAAILLDIYFD